jgi:hypothetical protein
LSAHKYAARVNAAKYEKAAFVVVADAQEGAVFLTETEARKLHGFLKSIFERKRKCHVRQKR